MTVKSQVFYKEAQQLPWHIIDINKQLEFIEHLPLAKCFPRHHLI